MSRKRLINRAVRLCGRIAYANATGRGDSAAVLDSALRNTCAELASWGSAKTADEWYNLFAEA